MDYLYHCYVSLYMDRNNLEDEYVLDHGFLSAVAYFDPSFKLLNLLFVQAGESFVEIKIYDPATV